MKRNILTASPENIQDLKYCFIPVREHEEASRMMDFIKKDMKVWNNCIECVENSNDMGVIVRFVMREKDIFYNTNKLKNYFRDFKPINKNLSASYIFPNQLVYTFMKDQPIYEKVIVCGECKKIIGQELR